MVCPVLQPQPAINSEDGGSATTGSVFYYMYSTYGHQRPESHLFAPTIRSPNGFRFIVQGLDKGQRAHLLHAVSSKKQQ